MRLLKHLTLSLSLSALLAAPSFAHEGETPAIPAAEHAPIGVMQDHMHNKGEWMLSYRYMHMDMGGNRVGSTAISTADTLNQFMIAPLAMKMDMHMLGAMYGISDRITVMAMVPYIDKSMDLITRMGMDFNTGTGGVGDVKLSAMISLVKTAKHRLHINAGLSLPTGSIDERAAIPINPDAQLPYPMQVGSGNWDLMPGITYSGTSELFYWGAQASAVIRTGSNDRDWSLGDRVQVTAWNMVRLNTAFDVGLRATYTHWGNVDGADGELMPMMVQTANPMLQGGERLDLSLALNYQVQSGSLKGHRLAAEVTLPVWQNLDGPQMEQNWGLMVGWQKAF